jgi:hypothetical protein
MVDRHTLIEPGDPDDAENVDSMFGHPALVDYVHPDEQFVITNLDKNNEEFTISSGKAYISLTQQFTSDGGERNRLMVACEVPEQTVGLDDTGQNNYIWLQAQIGQTDSPQWVVTTSQSAPSDDSLLIAELNVENTDADSAPETLEVRKYYNRDGPNLIANSIDTANRDDTGTNPDQSGIAVDSPLILNSPLLDSSGSTILDSSGVIQREALEKELTVDGATPATDATVSPPAVEFYTIASDGTNTVDLEPTDSLVGVGWRMVIQNISGGTLEFQSSDFVGAEPTNKTSRGSTATIIKSQSNLWSVISQYDA